jgi:hypothetical protein
MVMWGLVDRNLTLLSDVEDFDSIDELLQMAGHAPPAAIETRGIRARAEIERRCMQWLADDEQLKPVYGGADDSDYAAAPSPMANCRICVHTQKTQKANLAAGKDRTPANCRLCAGQFYLCAGLSKILLILGRLRRLILDIPGPKSGDPTVVSPSPSPTPPRTLAGGRRIGWQSKGCLHYKAILEHCGGTSVLVHIHTVKHYFLYGPDPLFLDDGGGTPSETATRIGC